jgi:hypothetical protein
MQKCNENNNKLNQTGIQMIVALGDLARSVGFVVGNQLTKSRAKALQNCAPGL